MTTVQVPAHAGSREQAQSVVSNLPRDLAGQIVVLDCRGLTISTPSFFDEIVKEVLLERRADRLDVIEADDRARTHVTRAAQNRGVSERVRTALRI